MPVVRAPESVASCEGSWADPDGLGAAPRGRERPSPWSLETPSSLASWGHALAGWVQGVPPEPGGRCLAFLVRGSKDEPSAFTIHTAAGGRVALQPPKGPLDSLPSLFQGNKGGTFKKWSIGADFFFKVSMKLFGRSVQSSVLKIFFFFF